MHEVMKWSYRTKDGGIIGHVSRFEESGHGDASKPKKKIIPYFKEGGKAGIPDNFDPANRLYGMDSIKDFSKTVFIVEGEKCAFALHGLGYQAVTSLGGCAQVQLADWTSLEGTEEIYLLPDHDSAGYEYARFIYGQIKRLSPVKGINLLPFPLKEKADICDYLLSLPELDTWNGFADLSQHCERECIRSILDEYIGSHAKNIPASWKFLITKHKHKLIEANDFRAMKLRRPQILLSPWLAEGSISMIFADRGIGKTFFALSCALALVNGDQFLCYEADHPVSVLYMDGEMQAAAMQSRLIKLSKGKASKTPLTIYTPDCQDNDYTPDLGTEAGRAEINEIIEAANPKVVFIDNLSTFDRTGNENEAESWAPIQEWAIQHRKKGRCIIFIHHANKEGKQRGSHKKEDVMDAVIRLKRPEDYIQGEGSTKILIHYTKARHLSGEQQQDIEATLLGDGDHLIWQWQQGDIAYHKTVQMLKDGMNMRDTAEEIGVTKSTIGRWKTRAQSEGLL